jgi:transcriptional regulator with XRE-family HTH domain
MTLKTINFSDLKGLGERLREVRKAQKRPMQDIASVLNVHQTAISRWERGESEPPLEYLVYALNALKAPSIDWLLTGKDCGKAVEAPRPSPEIAGLLTQARTILEADHPVITPVFKQTIEANFWSVSQFEPEKKPGVAGGEETPVRAKAGK